MSTEKLIAPVTEKKFIEIGQHRNNEGIAWKKFQLLKPGSKNIFNPVPKKATELKGEIKYYWDEREELYQKQKEREETSLSESDSDNGKILQFTPLTPSPKKAA